MHNKKVKILISITMAALFFTGCGRQKSTIHIQDVEQEAAVEVPIEDTEEVLMEETAAGEISDSDLEIYDRVTAELDGYIAEQDFERFFIVYAECKETYPVLSDKLEEKKVQYTEQIASVFDGWIAEADSLTLSGDKENAKEKIDAIVVALMEKSDFEELDLYNNIADERLSYYYDYNKAKEPVNLMGKEFDMQDGCYYRDEDYGKNVRYEDRYGNSFKEYYELIVVQANMQEHRPFVIFNADNNYDMFHASITCHNGMTEDKLFHIEVYGDDTQLYVSDVFSSYDEPMAVDVEIKGYKLIKFVAVREDHNLSYATAQPSVAVYAVNFSNTEIPEFEYYVPQNQM